MERGEGVTKTEDRMERRRSLVDFWTVRTRTIVPWTEIERALPRHLAYETALAAQGLLLLAGPFITAERGLTGDGFSVYATETEAQALDLARQDPFIVEGMREVTSVERWSIRRVGSTVGDLRSEDRGEDRPSTRGRSVTLLGTGRIGSALARRWAASGWYVTAWNRTLERAAPLEEFGIRVVPDISDAVDGADLIVTIVSDGAALADVLSSVGETSAQGAVVVDLSTIDSSSAERAAESLSARGLGFVAGAVSGSPGLVEAGRASLMLSGADADVAVAEALLAPVVAGITRVGSHVEAKVIKIAINSMVGGAVLMLAEATLMVELNGIEREAFFAALSKSGIWSPVVHYKSDALRDRDFTITATTNDLLADVMLASEQHRRGETTAPVTEAIVAALRSAVEAGYGFQDCITVTSALQARAGLRPDTLPGPPGPDSGGDFQVP